MRNKLLLLRKKPNNLVFSMTFLPGIIPAGLVTTIAGTRWDYLSELDDNTPSEGIITEFGPNTPTITHRGLRGCSAYTQYLRKYGLSGSGSDTLTLVAAGTYTCWIKSLTGTGSCTVSGASTGNGVSVDGTPITFTTASENTIITLTYAGQIDRLQVNSGSHKFPYIPSAAGPCPVASVSENIDPCLRFYVSNYPNLKTVLNGRMGKIHIEVWAMRPTISYHNILKTDGPGISHPLYFEVNGAFTSYDGTSFCSSTVQAIPADNKYAVDIRYGHIARKYMLIANGSASSDRAYDESWNITNYMQVLSSRSGYTVENNMYLKTLKIYKTPGA